MDNEVSCNIKWIEIVLDRLKCRVFVFILFDISLLLPEKLVPLPHKNSVFYILNRESGTPTYI